MLQLVQTPCDARTAEIFEQATALLGDAYRAAYWRSWHTGYPFLPADGAHHTFLIGVDGGTTPFAYDGYRTKLPRIDGVLSEALGWFLADRYENSAAMILRPKSLIMLYGAPTQADLFIQAPEMSAHEGIVDVAALEAEFPNIFRIH